MSEINNAQLVAIDTIVNGIITCNHLPPEIKKEFSSELENPIVRISLVSLEMFIVDLTTHLYFKDDLKIKSNFMDHLWDGIEKSYYESADEIRIPQEKVREMLELIQTLIDAFGEIVRTSDNPEFEIANYLSKQMGNKNPRLTEYLQIHQSGIRKGISGILKKFF